MPVYTILCQSMAILCNTRMDELIIKIQLGLPVGQMSLAIAQWHFPQVPG